MAEFESSTRTIPVTGDIPRHVAIIMDGNGRWARSRFLPRVAGHRKGLEAVRETVKACAERGVKHLTLFAFSSENWRRPADEVSFLMHLFLRSLEQEVSRLHENGIRFRVIGDLSAFDPAIVEHVARAEALTATNDRLVLTVAANYGGRWDILQAANQCAREHPGEAITEGLLSRYLCLRDAPEPDLFIRTGGEERISNFLIWQLAYTELFFTPVPWPDFGAKQLDEAITSYQQRERRFGRTSEQLAASRPQPDVA